MSRSASFPNMIDSNSGGFKEIGDKEAVCQNIKLLLQSSKTELLGDPYFGTNLKQLLYEPNDAVLKDIVIDEIYTMLNLFVKEVSVRREDIQISQSITGKVDVSIKVLYNKDGTNDLLSIPLLSSEEN